MKEVPNLTFLNAQVAGHDVINIRGLSTSTFTNNNPLIIYIDGVAHSSVYGFDALLANAERVEVLRGAQGVIYGKDAIGGVINIVTKRPADNLTIKTNLEYGANNSAFGRFNLSSAIAPDTLWFGLNGQFATTDGFIKNDYPNMRRKADAKHDHKIGGFILYESDDTFSAKLTVNNDHVTNRWFPILNVIPGVKLSDYSHSMIKRARFEVDQKETKDTNTGALSLSLNVSDIKFDAVTAYRKFKNKGLYDGDFTDDPVSFGLTNFMQINHQSLSQELRASSNNLDALNWILGVYFEDEEHKQGPFGMGMPMIDPATGLKIGDMDINAPSIADATTYALFGQIMLPFADNFELTLGGRMQSVKKGMDLTVYNIMPANDGLDKGMQIFAMKGSKTWHKFLPKAALNWQFKPNWMSYVSYAEGYMAGGFSYFTTQGTLLDNAFRPQINKTLETGIKGSLGDINLATTLFYMDIKDIHIYTTTGQIYTVSNAPKARSYGLEAEGSWMPSNTNIELSAALGLINAKYKNKGDAHLKNKHIQDTPQHTLRLGAAYFDPSNFYARLDAHNIGARYFFDNQNVTFIKDKAHTVLDVRSGYKSADWEIYGKISNLTNHAYITYYNGHFLALNAPRTYALGVRYDF